MVGEASAALRLPFSGFKKETHTCAYCGTRTTKYCATCLEIGRGSIAVCGRKSGRGCVDLHASGQAVKHASWNLCKRMRDDENEQEGE